MSSMPFPADVMTADTDSMQLDMDAADGTIEDDVSMRDEHTVHVPSQDETPDGGSVQTTTEPSSNAADPLNDSLLTLECIPTRPASN